MNGDSEIVPAAKTGSLGTFKELHSMYSRRLYRTILAITKNHEDAEDALQDTFLRAYLGIHNFEGRSSVYSWLTSIARNSALMILRRRRVRAEVCCDSQSEYCTETMFPEIADPTPNPEQLCAARQRRIALLLAVRKLKAPLREPIQMRLTRESSLKDISRALNISEAAVKARLFRARSRLGTVCARG